MNNKTKNSFLSKHSFKIGIALVIVALVAGVYFLFRPFPTGSSLDVKAEAPEAASIAGWSAVANPPEMVQAAGIATNLQRLDLGAGYVLETDQQGTRIVAPVVPSVSSSAVQTLDIGSGYVLELNSTGGRIVAPADPAAAALAGQASSIPSSVLSVIGSNVGRHVSSAASSQRLDLGAGYVLVTDAQGTRIVAPTTQLKGETVTSATGYPTRIDLGGGYTLVIGPDGQGEIVKAP